MKSQINLASTSRHHYPSLTVSRVLAIAFLLGVALIGIPAAQAQFSVIHNFTGGLDGSVPYSGLTLDPGGNLYGTTSSGSAGYGTVYKISPKNGSWLLSTLYSFTGGRDGGIPAAGVIRDQNGLLYGATFGGGADDAGVVFQLRPPSTVSHSTSPPWTETTLYSFTGGSDGGFPDMIGGYLSFDSTGNLYGTTLVGGTPSCDNGNPGCGTVFQLAHSHGSWTEHVLHPFQGGSDGSTPYGGVVLDAQGTVYGATFTGGNDSNYCPYGCGTVYQVVHSERGWQESVVLGLCLPNECLEGSEPTGIAIDSSGYLYTASDSAVIKVNTLELDLLNPNLNLYAVGNLIMDGAGNLYGTTVTGGAHGYGAVFKLTPANPYWTYTSLHDFTGGSDGGEPYGTLLFDSRGNLYGTANVGGSGNSCQGGCGVIFEITP